MVVSSLLGDKRGKMACWVGGGDKMRRKEHFLSNVHHGLVPHGFQDTEEVGQSLWCHLEETSSHFLQLGSKSINSLQIKPQGIMGCERESSVGITL